MIKNILMRTLKKISLISTAIAAVLAFVSCGSVPNPNTMVLQSSWQIQSQDKIAQTGEEISNSDYSTKEWIQTSVPNTVLAALVEAGVYTDIYKDQNLEKIETSQFAQAWWYRTQFNVESIQFHQLVFEGLNYRANIWLNGQLIADSSLIEGAFGIWQFDVTSQLKEGANVLAVQVFPPKFDDLTIGFVDWNPAPPDKNMGLWRPVKLISTGMVSMEEPFVNTLLNTETLKEAKLVIATQLRNHSLTQQRITLEGKIGELHFEKVVELQANESKKIEFQPSEFKQLIITDPKLWWPNLMGEQHLYTLNLKASVKNQISDVKEVRFGIRKVEDYWTDDHHKGYKINGKKVLIKGAGWVDDMLLADTDAKVIAQMEYVKHMNLNCVRLEGFWGRNKTLYDKADELGLLLMIGWSCQWEWEGYCGRYEDNYMCIRTPEDMELQSRAYQSQVKWLRNHPSIFTWVYGSDKLPRPELEVILNNYIGQVDTTRPILVSCKGTDFDLVKDEKGNIIHGYTNQSEISGPTGVKMLGPYAYTAPNYWYLDKKAGGAYGFNTETGPGPQVPTIESLNKMISDKHLWPLNELWNYHSGRNEFATLNRYVTAFNARYGKAQNAADFAFCSQISNYEAIRAMFEAFEANKPNATGVIQWMLNSAWPEMFWQLYDWYLMPNGAFYGTKKACQPVNAIYNYGDKNIYLSNDLLTDYKNLELEATVYDQHSNLVFTKKISTDLEAIKSIKALDLPDFKGISTTYFLNLELSHQGSEVSTNFYWLSTQADVNDWENSKWFFTPLKEYADFTALQQLEKVDVKSTFTSTDTETGDKVITCMLENNASKIAFFLELSIKDKATGETIVPVFWDDNYISLMPGEKRTISAKLQKQHIQNKEFTYSIKGLNTK
jgi:exo-1,4-beta-D-glucosaminidase